jgi:hypothetical protein
MASCGMIYAPSFMKIGTGVQEIRVLRFCLRNSRECNVGITDGRDFLITPLRWAQMPDIYNKLYKQWFRHSKVKRGGHTQQGYIISLLLYFKIRKVQ